MTDTPAQPKPAVAPVGICGPADLVRAYAAGGASALVTMAELAGYGAKPRHHGHAISLSGHLTATATVTASPVVYRDGRVVLDDVPFRRPVERHFLTPGLGLLSTSPPEPPPPDPLGSGDEIRGADLAPWNRLLPRLRADATAWVQGQAPDMATLVRRVEKGRLLDRIPRHPRRRWGAAVQVIVDRAERLVPFYDDQDQVEEWLSRLFPAFAMERAVVLNGLADPMLQGRRGRPVRYRLPPPGTLVLVLGDLGCLAADGERLARRWAAFGRRLAVGGCRAVALTPCPRPRWRREPACWWTMVEWERGAACPSDPAILSQRVERLLTLVSPAVRLEPGLLRDIRRLLGPMADAGTESDLWQHPVLAGRSSVGGILDSKTATMHRTRFREQALAPRVVETLRRHRAGLAREIWVEELMRLEEAVLPPDVQTRDVPWARNYLADLALTLEQRPGGTAWFRRVAGRGLADMKGTDIPQVRAALSMMYAKSIPAPDRHPPPPGFDVTLAGDDGQPERTVTLWQVGDALTLEPPVSSIGSPLVTLRTANGLVTIKEGEDRSAFWKTGTPPAWAQDWGWDEFGAWVTFGIDGITQRLRWIPPGHFLMGSPEDELGRDNDEGPQHAVTLSRGYWLFDAACTQALWQAMMGKNPSHFKGDDRRPVDSVSWHDVQDFLARLNSRVPGLELGLPTEAQWEYACRSGTVTPFSFGGTITPEQVNYNGDYPYADGAKGLYRKETVPVGSLPPNAWGLYEMHGNLWEWCADGPRDYTAQPETDPRGPESSVAERVLRGGSWIFYARFARAAVRRRRRPDGRYDAIGFRCARVQARSQASPEDAAEPAAPALPRLAERRGTQGAAGGAVLRVDLGAGAGARCPLPPAPAFHIRTDREELRVERITRPAWAESLGRDRFGLWTEIVVKPEGGGDPVTQRLRWIPPGRFLMGSPDDELGRGDDEGPQHAVTLSRGYWLFDTACTRALWQAVMGENPSHFKDDDRRPVDSVSWHDVQDFLTRLNGRFPGLELSLPTEAQWEYACRAGTATPFSFGGTITPEQVNYNGDYPYADGAKGLYRKETVPVGSLPPNAWGLYEMHGNLWEWCADGKRTYTSEPETDPRGPESAVAERVLRGGSWIGSARGARAAVRARHRPDDRYVPFGFRCARVQA